MNSILRWPNGGSGRQQVQSSAIVRQLSCHCLCRGDSMMISFHFNRRAVTIPSAGTNMCILWIWSDMVCVVVSWTCVHVCVKIAPLFYIYLQSVPPLMWALAQNREGGRRNYNEKEEGLGMNCVHCVSWYLGHCNATSHPSLLSAFIMSCVCVHVHVCICQCGG